MSTQDPGDPSSSSLRERNKAKRRDAILDAALHLLGTQEVSGVTTEQIAARAEVSTATVYNLVGTRDDVMQALLTRFTRSVTQALAADIAAGKPERADELWLSRLLFDRSLSMLAEHSAAYRHVVMHLGGMGPAAQGLQRHDGPTLDSAPLHEKAIRRAQRSGMIRKGLDPSLLAAQISGGLNAALLRWSYGGLRDDQLSTFARHGLATVLLASCTESHRRRLQSEFTALQKRLGPLG